MVQKYKNLAGKIKSAREKAKLSQEKLGKIFEPASKNVTRTAVTQWEMGATEPSEEKLLAIAKLHGEDYWWYLCWFADDEVAADRYVEYDNSGNRIVLEPLWSEPDREEMEVMWAEEREIEAQIKSPPQNNWMSEAVKHAPGELLETFRKHFDKKPPDRKPIKDDDEVSQKLTVERDPFTNKPTGAKITFNSASVNAVVDLGESGKSEGGLAAVAQYMRFKDEQLWRSSTEDFTPMLRHFVKQKLPFSASHFNVPVAKGSFKGGIADYYDESTLIEIVITQSKWRNQEIQRGLGKLFLCEKLLNRSLGKMLVVCIDAEKPSTNPKLLEDVAIARSLGVTMLYGNPYEHERLAEEISTFIRETAEARVARRTLELAKKGPKSE